MIGIKQSNTRQILFNIYYTGIRIDPPHSQGRAQVHDHQLFPSFHFPDLGVGQAGAAPEGPADAVNVFIADPQVRHPLRGVLALHLRQRVGEAGGWQRRNRGVYAAVYMLLTNRRKLL